MTGRTLYRTCTRSALAFLAAVAFTACGKTEPATDASRLARGRELVQQMSTRLAAANAVTAVTTETRERVHAGGRKESVSQTAVYTMRRPNRFYTKLSAGLESWYNGKTITIAVHPDKVFAQAPMPDTIDRTLDALAERYDMALPLSDLFYASAEKALLSESTTGGYVGLEPAGGTPCTHLAFKDVGTEWELWLPQQGELLPKRFRVVQKRRTGEPVTDVTFTEWNLAPSITDATFVPRVPAEYEGIAAVQRAAAIKHASADPRAAAVVPATGK